MSKHYRKTLKDGTDVESIDYIQGIMKDKFQYGCWFNVLKYPVRVYDKHESPIPDIKKTMHYCLFWLNDLNGKQATYNQDKLFKIFEEMDNKQDTSHLNVDWMAEYMKWNNDIDNYMK